MSMNLTYDWNGHTDMPVTASEKSDFEVAGIVRMLMRNDLQHEHICVMARDRIMGLSKANAALTARVAELEKALAARQWQPMDTAPKDGRHCILSVPEGAFYYSVQGAYHDGQWNAVHRDNVEPVAWMPNVLLPAELAPWKRDHSAALNKEPSNG